MLSPVLNHSTSKPLETHPAIVFLIPLPPFLLLLRSLGGQDACMPGNPGIKVQKVLEEGGLFECFLVETFNTKTFINKPTIGWPQIGVTTARNYILQFYRSNILLLWESVIHKRNQLWLTNESAIKSNGISRTEKQLYSMITQYVVHLIASRKSSHHIARYYHYY